MAGRLLIHINYISCASKCNNYQKFLLLIKLWGQKGGITASISCSNIALRSSVFIFYIYKEPPGYPLHVAVTTISLQRLSPPSVPTVWFTEQKILITIMLRSMVFIVYMYEKPSGYPLLVAVAIIILQRLSPPSVPTVWFTAQFF